MANESNVFRGGDFCSGGLSLAMMSREIANAHDHKRNVCMLLRLGSTASALARTEAVAPHVAEPENEPGTATSQTMCPRKSLARMAAHDEDRAAEQAAASAIAAMQIWRTAGHGKPREAYADEPEHEQGPVAVPTVCPRKSLFRMLSHEEDAHADRAAADALASVQKWRSGVHTQEKPLGLSDVMGQATHPADCSWGGTMGKTQSRRPSAGQAEWSEPPPKQKGGWPPPEPRKYRPPKTQEELDWRCWGPLFSSCAVSASAAPGKAGAVTADRGAGAHPTLAPARTNICVG
eukprot:NODE_15798_length_1030_cov_2.380952.p1 GENE.NODE_15798_length_1030_cov_2.380952~~NODE_15798_length_1030_cov_2.380952.p1  ORF type:complete len:298 (-),score=47.73 NODE_15798_length_1030_cov_2.380952:136-1008(-)